MKPVYSIRLGSEIKTIDRPWIMGIINATPDSFFASSRTTLPDAIRDRAAAMVAAGVDIIDIGGYSSRPGAPDISPDEEWERLLTALDVIRTEWPRIPVSVDTFRSQVAHNAVTQWNVEIINDISGGDLDPDMFETVARLNAAYILMHMRGNPSNMQSLTDYRDVTAEVLADLAVKNSRLAQLGVADVIIDPGFGFAKNVTQNYELLANLEAFHALGHPLLVGMSRKSMIWRPCEISPAESLPGTIALHSAAIMKGADIIRVHDVPEAVQMRDVLTLLKASSGRSSRIAL